MFEVYRGVKDEAKRAHLIQEAWHDLSVIKEILKADPVLIEDLFRPFDYLADSVKQTVGDAVGAAAGDAAGDVARDAAGSIAVPENILPHADIQEMGLLKEAAS